MNPYILDTNILIAYLRQSQVYFQVEAALAPFQPPAAPGISVVTLAELLSFGFRNGWGAARYTAIKNLCNQLMIIDINLSDQQLLDAYKEIDAFSQGKHPNIKLNRSAVNMGKNDLWIAATAHAGKAELVTTDKDFLHLDGVFFKVHCF